MPKRKTNEQYIEECKQKGYDLPIEPYVNTHTKIKHKCSNGHIYEQTPHDHLDGHGCPLCAGNVQRTMEEYIKECKKQHLDLPIKGEKYVNNSTNIKHRCKKCGYVYSKPPVRHLNQKQQCPKCTQLNVIYNMYKTPKEHYDDCVRLGIDTPLDDYKGNKIKLRYKCANCGFIYKQRPDSHTHYLQGCPKCAGTMRLTMEQYIERCKGLGLDLPIKGEKYINNKTKIKHKCIKGHIYEQKPNCHLDQKQGCPYCSGVIKRTNKYYYIQQCKELNMDLPIEEYKGSNIKINHRCAKCGKVYKQAPSCHLQGQGCPYCSQSHGEKFIQNYLDKHNIPYITQKKFPDCVYKNELPFDFCLPKQKILIEYQGLQHFEWGNLYNRTKKDLQKRKMIDRIKKDYAINNDYILLEPTYKLDTQEKINKYLDEHLK